MMLCFGRGKTKKEKQRKAFERGYNTGREAMIKELDTLRTEARKKEEKFLEEIEFLREQVRNAQNASSCSHDRPLNEATGFEADDGGSNHLPASSELQPHSDAVDVLMDVEKTPEEEVQQNPPPSPGTGCASKAPPEEAETTCTQGDVTAAATVSVKHCVWKFFPPLPGYEAFAPHGETEAAVSGTAQATDSASKTINRHVHQMPPPPGFEALVRPEEADHVSTGATTCTASHIPTPSRSPAVPQGQQNDIVLDFFHFPVVGESGECAQEVREYDRQSYREHHQYFSEVHQEHLLRNAESSLHSHHSLPLPESSLHSKRVARQAAQHISEWQQHCLQQQVNYNRRLQQQWEYCQHLQRRLHSRQMGQRRPQPGVAVITGYQVAPAAEPVNRIMEHRPDSLAMHAIRPDLSTSTEPVASCGQHELTDEAMHDLVNKILS